MTFRILFLTFVVAFFAPDADAGNYSQTGHGNPTTGPSRSADIPRGSCGQCHTEKSSAQKYPKGLWRENDNELCFTCHRDMNISGVYPGSSIFEASDHRTDPRFVWPGPYPPPRMEVGAAGKCLNCHNPHGAKDRAGLIPSLLIAREEELCLTCHDGSPSVRNIAREIRKPFNHPARFTERKHSADEGGEPARFSYTGGYRHAECADCHNPHAANADPLPPVAPKASNRNSRVSRVRVLNGAAGTIPMYQFVSAFDLSAPSLEYEICFKCHSSWTQQPARQPDMAVLFNTNNASYHPVEGQGKNFGIDANSFVGGRNAFSTIYCSDCHGSDDSNLRGPHGSQFPAILRRSYLARSFSRVTGRDELCFTCHNFDAYVNPAGLFQQASRFNPPLSPNGHAFHVGQRNIPCYACHDSHGSPEFPALIVVGRNPGLINFSARGDGGSCLSTCHGFRSYLINYPR